MDNNEQAQMASPAVEAPAQQPTAPEFSLNDLQNLRAIVDTAVRRGAFGASEASAVGAVFDRLNTFLNAVAPQQAPADSAPAPTA
jgi:hypothetical protein